MPSLFPSSLSTPVLVAGSALGSAPAERDVPRAVASLLHQRFVELPPGAGMYARPAVFAVILQTGDVGTEERGKLPTTARALALITHLIIQHIWLHFHLHPKRKDRKTCLAKLRPTSSCEGLQYGLRIGVGQTKARVKVQTKALESLHSQMYDHRQILNLHSCVCEVCVIYTQMCTHICISVKWVQQCPPPRALVRLKRGSACKRP